jgi:hypothetical protein
VQKVKLASYRSVYSTDVGHWVISVERVHTLGRTVHWYATVRRRRGAEPDALDLIDEYRSDTKRHAIEIADRLVEMRKRDE